MHLLFLNRRVIPYNLQDDVLSFKLSVIEKNRQFFTPSVSGYVYGNIASGAIDYNLGYFQTNEYGTTDFYYSTNSIPDRYINTANFWASGYYLNREIHSSMIKANFINRTLVDEYIINAGTCDGLDGFDRSNFRIYNATREPQVIINRTRDITW